MNKSSKWIVAVCLAVMCVAAYAVDHSTPSLTESATIQQEPITPWRVAFNSSSVDGAAIANPFSWGTWSTVSAELATSGGRMCLNRKGQRRFEVLPLFTTAGATATMQLFGFDYVLTDSVPSGSTGSLVAPGSSGINLGCAYNLAQDSGVRTFTVSATSDTVKLGIVTSGSARGCVYPDQSGGTIYYQGQRLIFDTAGLFAFIPYVVTISGGTVVLLVRVV